MRSVIRLGILVLGASCAATAEPDVETSNAELVAPVWATGGESLNVRARPTTQSEIVGSIPPNTNVDIECQVEGELVQGTPVWDYIPSRGGYVTDAHLWTGYDGFSPELPRCASGGGGSSSSSGGGSSGGSGGGGPPVAKGFLLPLACGQSATVTQARGQFSHFGAAYWGTDFGLANDTPLVAVDDGRVSLVRNDVRPGNGCYSGGGSGCANTLNYVVLQHADGTDTAYLHVNRVLVAPGQVVRRGERIALSGGTGWSTGPHAHVQRQTRCGSWWCQSVQILYGDIPGGDTWTGQRVTSRNCAAGLATSP